MSKEETPKLPELEKKYEYEVTVIHNGRLAPVGKVFIIVRIYSNYVRKIKGRMAKDKWQGHVQCDRTDIAEPEALKVITDHLYQQIVQKYKLKHGELIDNLYSWFTEGIIAFPFMLVGFTTTTATHGIINSIINCIKPMAIFICVRCLLNKIAH